MKNRIVRWFNSVTSNTEEPKSSDTIVVPLTLASEADNRTVVSEQQFKSITKNTILKQSSIALACINYIALQISKSDLLLHQLLEDKEGVVKNRVAKDMAINYLVSKKPNRFTNSQKFFEKVITQLLVHGNAFIWVKMKAGEVSELVILPKNTTMEDRANNGNYIIKSNLYGQELNLKIEEVIHLVDIPDTNSSSPFGLSRIDCLLDKLSSIANASIVTKKIYNSDGEQVKGAIKVLGETDDETKAKIKSAFIKSIEKDGIAIYDDGDLEFTSINYNNTSLVDGLFIQVLEEMKLETISAFGLSPALLGDVKSTTNSNMIETYNEFMQTTVEPLCKQIELEFTDKCLTTDEKINKGYYFSYNTKKHLRMSPLVHADYLCKLSQNGHISTDEVRAEILYNTLNIPESSIPRVDLNHVSIDKADEYQLSKAGAKGGDNNE